MHWARRSIIPGLNNHSAFCSFLWWSLPCLVKWFLNARPGHSAWTEISNAINVFQTLSLACVVQSYAHSFQTLSRTWRTSLSCKKLTPCLTNTSERWKNLVQRKRKWKWKRSRKCSRRQRSMVKTRWVEFYNPHWIQRSYVVQPTFWTLANRSFRCSYLLSMQHSDCLAICHCKHNHLVGTDLGFL